MKALKCEICGEELRCTWTDFHGEGTCNTCGAPYQLKEYSGAPPDQKYPHITGLKPEFIPIFKEHWEKTRRKVRLGRYVIPADYSGVAEERAEFDEWLKNNHPEWL